MDTTDASLMTLLLLSEVFSDTRCCCASHYSRQVFLQRASSRHIKEGGLFPWQPSSTLSKNLFEAKSRSRKRQCVPVTITKDSKISVLAEDPRFPFPGMDGKTDAQKRRANPGQHSAGNKPIVYLRMDDARYG